MTSDGHAHIASARGYLTVAGIVAIVMSLIALVVGLITVGTTAGDLRQTVRISGSAVEVIADTMTVVDDATSEIKDGLDAAAEGVAGVSATTTVAASGLEDVAVFLETDLPEDLEAIRSSMPAAIQAAGAIDSTLRALSFVGVDYNPAQPFDQSLIAVEDALADLPDDLRSQAEALRELVPATADLGGEADRLAIALRRVGEDLDEVKAITGSYTDTLAEAREAITRVDSSFGRNIWLLRLAIIAMGFGGVAVGIGLMITGRAMDATLARVDDR